MKKLSFGLALAIALALPVELMAQKRQAGAARNQTAGAAQGQTEPLRTINGQMRGKKISAQVSDGRASFDYTLTRAQVVDGKLQFQGAISAPGKAGTTRDVTATLVGTLARSSNPWPSAGDRPPSRKTIDPNTQRQGREARNPETAGQIGQLAQSTQDTARTTTMPKAPQGQKPAAGEVTEQTQSLYAATDAGTGCEVMNLKLPWPLPRAAGASANQPVQLGVVLVPIDNRLGEEINQHVCRIVRGLSAQQGSDNIEAQLDQLNRLLAQGR